MPKHETKPLEWFQPDANELARHDDPEETRRLGQDLLARGQLQRVAAIEDGRMIFGHGRYLAAKAVGIKTLEVRIYPAMSDSRTPPPWTRKTTAWCPWRSAAPLRLGTEFGREVSQFRIEDVCGGTAQWIIG
jgi:hypothetical protein